MHASIHTVHWNFGNFIGTGMVLGVGWQMEGHVVRSEVWGWVGKSHSLSMEYGQSIRKKILKM